MAIFQSNYFGCHLRLNWNRLILSHIANDYYAWKFQTQCPRLINYYYYFFCRGWKANRSLPRDCPQIILPSCVEVHSIPYANHMPLEKWNPWPRSCLLDQREQLNTPQLNLKLYSWAREKLWWPKARYFMASVGNWRDRVQIDSWIYTLLIIVHWLSWKTWDVSFFSFFPCPLCLPSIFHSFFPPLLPSFIRSFILSVSLSSLTLLCPPSLFLDYFSLSPSLSHFRFQF